jgi:hypothetical protein
MQENDYGVDLYDAGRWMRLHRGGTLVQMMREFGWSEYTAKAVLAAGQLGMSGYLPTGTRKVSALCRPLPQFGPDEMERSIQMIGDVRERVQVNL